ncbi:MAG: hypothetical protein ACUVUD_05870 [bacterium]
MAIKTVDSGALTQNRTGRTSTFSWEPAKIGPSFEWLDYDTIRILEGGMAGKILGVKTEILRHSATITLFDDKAQIGIESIERDPPEKGVILWDAAIKERFRRNGLAAIMTWIIFRELLTVQDVATFRIRMVRSLKAGERGAELQNVGMGIIAVRLGFTPELNLKQLLTIDHITGIKPLPPLNGSPPAVVINLKRDPFVLIAFVLNPDTMKPSNNFRTYQEIMRDYGLIHKWAEQGGLVVNGNYRLRESQANYFVNRIAVSETEAVIFRNKIRGL